MDSQQLQDTYGRQVFYKGDTVKIVDGEFAETMGRIASNEVTGGLFTRSYLVELDTGVVATIQSRCMELDKFDELRRFEDENKIVLGE